MSYWKLNEHTYRCEIPSHVAARFIFFFHVSNGFLLEKLLPFSSIVSFYSPSSICQNGFPVRLLPPLSLMALPHAPPMLPCKPLGKHCIYRHQKRKRASPEKPCSCCTEAAWNPGHFSEGNIVIEAAQPSEVPGNFEMRNLWGKDKWNLRQAEQKTYHSSSLIPSNQLNATQHKNNVRRLSDCLKFSFDIWRKNTINSELELT